MKMRMLNRWVGVLAVMAGGLATVRGDVLLGWNVQGLSGTPDAITSVVKHVSMENGVLTRGSGLGAATATDGFSANSWTLPSSSTISDAVASNDYFTFTAIAQSGQTFDVTNFSWRATRSSTGPSNFVLRSSVDSFAADLAVFGTTGTAERAFTTALNLTAQTNVEFRIYGFASPSSTGSGRLTDGSSFGQAGLDMTLFGTATGGFVPTNVQFNSSAASAAESIGTYTVTVFKTLADGNVSGNVALSGTAAEGGGNDYTLDTTNFTMNGATTSATFVVSINNDTNTEPSETVILTLANVIGGTVVSPSVFTLTITDDDVPPQAPEGIAAFRFATGPHLQVSSKDANITVSDMSLGTGTIETNVTTGTYFPNEPYAEETGGWAVDNQGSAKSFRFTLTPNVGYQVSITGISFRAYATGAGPSAMGYDIGGAASFSLNATNDTLITVSQVVSGVDNQAGGIFIQIQGWTNGTRQSSGTGPFRLDDVIIFGLVTPTGDTPPVLAAIGNKSVLTNAPISFSVAATPTEGDTVTLSVSNSLPLGATFGSTNEVGTFEWLAPGPVGVYTMTFYAADNDGVDTEQITISVTSTPVDIDGDLIPNEWEVLYFGGATNATATADDDGDGFLNIEEFVAQTIPVLPSGATSFFRNVSIAASARSVGYPSVTGRQYRLYGSTNLLPGIDWTQVAGPQAGNGSGQSLQEGSATTSSYFRLTVEMINP